MEKPETLNYEERYKDAVVAFSPFVLGSTGILQSQTLLKVENHSLTCVPYRLSMGAMDLVVSLSREELAFFQRFVNALAGLTIFVQAASDRETRKIFCRCTISAIAPLRGRDNVGLVSCGFKPIPHDLSEIMGEHLLRVERLREEWEGYRDRSVQVNPESSRRLGFNNFAVMSVGGEQHKLALFTLAANRADFLMPLRSPDVAVGTEAAFILYFRKYRFGVGGRIEESTRLPTGVQRIKAALAFSPELTEIMSDYFLTERARAKKH